MVDMIISDPSLSFFKFNVTFVAFLHSMCALHLKKKNPLYNYVQVGEQTEDNMYVQGTAALLLTICVNDNDNSDPKFNRSAIQQIIQHRIGAEIFKARLDKLIKSDSFTNAAKVCFRL